MRSNWKIYKKGQYCLVQNEDVFIRDYSTPKSPLFWWCVEHQGIVDGETDSLESAQDAAEMALARLKKSHNRKMRLANRRTSRKAFNKPTALAMSRIRKRYLVTPSRKSARWESRMSFFAWWDVGTYAYDMLRYMPAGARPVGLLKKAGGA